MEKNEVYVTEAFIVKKEVRGEENERITLYTEKYGLISVHSQASKSAKSKLRTQLNTHALLYVNLVHGKSGWKLTGAEEIESPFHFSRDSRFSLLHSLAELIHRFEGSEENRKLWGEVEYLFSVLRDEENTNLFESNLDEMKLILTIRTLSALGYWNRPGKRLPRYTKQDCELVKNGKTTLEEKIAEAVKETQL